jgi:CTP:molybdopterin cytidylyltransferase MocA
MQTDPVAAVILSAGYSSRMGRLKPLLPLGESTVMERVVALFAAAGLTEIVVVLGHAREEIQAVLPPWVRVAHNPEFASGMFSSVRAGAAALSPETRAFFMLPVDIPLVDLATLQSLLDAHRENPHGIIYPCYQGRRGHPPLIPAPVISQILDHPPEGNLRQVLSAHALDAVNLEVADRNILFDIDNPEDYQELLQRWRQAPPSP